MAVAKKTTVPNLQRGMAILEYLATSQRNATIAELSERLGYPAASVFRITQELTELGYLARDPATKRYRLTNKFLLLGQPQSRQRGLVEAALPAMRGVHKETKETTQLCCLIDVENVVLEQILSSHPFKYSVELGARCPAFSCAPGKAAIAGLPEDEQDELVDRLQFKKFTSRTITSRPRFRQELKEIAACGYAVDRGEGLDGIHCVAAAISDRKGHPTGAITIAGPASRIPEEDFSDFGKIVAQAALAAERAFQS